jgi:hypothetical protein
MEEKGEDISTEQCRGNLGTTAQVVSPMAGVIFQKKKRLNYLLILILSRNRKNLCIISSIFQMVYSQRAGDIRCT